MEQIWRDGYEYNKAGVMLGNFSRLTRKQITLFEKPAMDNSQIMAVIDRIYDEANDLQILIGRVDYIIYFLFYLLISSRMMFMSPV